MLTILERPSPNYDSRRGAAIDCVVIHDTECAEAASAVAWFESRASEVSAHYVIDRDGTVYRCVADADRAWHAGHSALDGRQDVNTYSIGIELAGFANSGYTPAQLDSCVELCLRVCLKYKVASERIVGHADVALPPGRKHDPGPHFPWAELRGRLSSALAISLA